MACLEMYNSDHQHKGHCPPISPRISFSNDFADSQQYRNNNNSNNSSSRSDFASSDFEFSVSNYSMMSADELFSKGRLLPFKSNSNQTQRTIRDELLAGDDDNGSGGISARPPKSGGGSNRWRSLWGLKRTHIGSKKIEHKISENGSSGDFRFRPGFSHEDNLHVANSSQEFLSGSEGGPSHGDVEIGI